MVLAVTPVAKKRGIDAGAVEDPPDLGGPWAKPRLSDPELVARTLQAFPMASAAVQSGNPEKRTKVRAPLTSLGSVTFGALFWGLSNDAFALLEMACVLGGVTRPTALVAALEADPSALIIETTRRVDLAAEQLIASGLAQLDSTLLRPAPEVEAGFPYRLPLVRHMLDGYTSEDLAQACKALGLKAGARKVERSEALLSFFYDREAVITFLGSQPGLEEMFERVMVASSAATAEEGRGTDPDDFVSVHSLLTDEDRIAYYQSARYAYRPMAHGIEVHPLVHLRATLLIGGRHHSYAVWGWGDIAALLFPTTMWTSWGTAPRLDLKPVATDSSRALGSLADLGRLLDAVDKEPLDAKRTGDRAPTVTGIKAAARSVGVDATTATVLVETGIELGLLVPHRLPKVGRGRNAEHPIEWRPEPVRRAQFELLDIHEQWRRLAAQIFAAHTPNQSGSKRAVERLHICAALATLPEGQGAAGATSHQWLAWRHNLLAYGAKSGPLANAAMSAVADLVALGICSAGDALGLTDAGRALLAGPNGVDDRLSDLFGHVEDGFVVQPDHTIVAPASLDPGLHRELSALAELESSGGATVWRLSPQRLTEAGSTRSVEEVLAFLNAHSTVAIPDGVTRLVQDTVGGASRVQVFEGVTVVICEDVAVLAEAARYKPAKLTLVSLNVATSPVPASKLRDLLRRKGVAVSFGLGEEPDRGKSSTPPAGKGGGTKERASSGVGKQHDVSDVAVWEVGHLQLGEPLPSTSAPGVTPDFLHSMTTGGEAR